MECDCKNKCFCANKCDKRRKEKLANSVLLTQANVEWLYKQPSVWCEYASNLSFKKRVDRESVIEVATKLMVELQFKLIQALHEYKMTFLLGCNDVCVNVLVADAMLIKKHLTAYKKEVGKMKMFKEVSEYCASYTLTPEDVVELVKKDLTFLAEKYKFTLSEDSLEKLK